MTRPRASASCAETTTAYLELGSTAKDRQAVCRTPPASCENDFAAGGRERLLVAKYALNALCTFGYVFVSTPTHLFLVQAGLGVSLALPHMVGALAR